MASAFVFVVVVIFASSLLLCVDAFGFVFASVLHVVEGMLRGKANAQ